MEKIKSALRGIQKINTRQLKFFVLVIILSAIVIGFSIYLVVFLLSNLNAALVADKDSQKAPVKFEIERFEKLNIGR